ncbi:long-chain fatty acid transporter [Acinetobacter sp. A3.8]|uniref:Long-chain fatty acid transporter n=1 Tax=Acinetobacter sedimenti TaxID=2919922 RepID=A0A9X2B8J1_9GAMM|nr:long-chain fatty acid transporter [Acinetobacter sedimenti]MCJ8146169.1 long-chain fatty acid transporter [Acinetobacter sedimenti]
MKIKTLTAALACALPVTGAFAAALDRSGQSVSAFLQPNNYAEASISILAPTVEGREAGTSTTTREIDDMAKDYVFGAAAIKVQPTSNFSFGILYDQPFGADAKYEGQNIFVSDSTNTILGADQLAAIGAARVESEFNNLTAAQIVGAALNAQGVDLTSAAGQAQYAATLAAYNAGGATADTINTAVRAAIAQQVAAGISGVNALLGTGATDVKVKTENLSFLFGFQPTENWNFYAGPVFQQLEGRVSLRGQAYSLYNGYDATIGKENGWGWLAGMAYQIPEIALKASVTYRSEIDYDANVIESIPTLPALALLGSSGGAAAAAIAAASGQTEITTPQSVNLDLQSGIMANTVAFAQIRWVDWSNFSIRPYKFGLVSEAVGPLVGRPDGFNLVEYSEDQISANVGVGRKLNDLWSGSVSVGWDSGAGNPVSTLGPTEGYWNVGLGVQYSPAPNYFVQAGAKYFWLGDAQAQTGAQSGGDEYVAEFEDNTAIAYGLKLGYRF